MWLWTTVDIADHERAFLYRRKRLVDVLGPGRYRVPVWETPFELEVFDITQLVFRHPRTAFLFKNFRFLLCEFLQLELLGANQLGVLYRNRVAVEIFPPGTHCATWKGVEELELKRFNLEENGRLHDDLLAELWQGNSTLAKDTLDELFVFATVPEHCAAVVEVDGRAQEVLAPGTYGFWKFKRDVRLELLELQRLYRSVFITGAQLVDGRVVDLQVELRFELSDVSLVSCQHLLNGDGLERELRSAVRRALLEFSDVDVDFGGLAREAAAQANRHLSKTGVEVKQCYVSYWQVVNAYRDQGADVDRVTALGS